MSSSSAILLMSSGSAILRLITLETRRLRGDQIEVLKILNWYEYIDRNMFFHSRNIVKLEDIR